MHSLKAMTRLKNKLGFLTFESIAAITLIGFFMTPLVIMQTKTVTRIADQSRSLQRLFFMKRFLYQARREQKDEPQQFTSTATEQDPATQLTYTLDAVSQESSLSSIPGLLQERVDAVATVGTKKPKNSIISFIYRPAPEKEQERI